MLRNCVIGLLAITLASQILAAQGKGKGKGHDKVTSAGGGSTSVDVVFTTGDTRVIVDYYRGGGGSGLPPGLAKRGGDLPPGLEKQLRRKGTLPPGLRKKIQPFPAPLVSRLPPLPGDCGCRRVVYDKWAMLIHDATNTIFDIIDLTR
ncbi:MAG: hypothetical protein ACRD8O_03755 [Bryobacteraceae bacterium]